MSDAKRIQRRFDIIEDELAAINAAEVERAAQHFPATGGSGAAAQPLAILPLHAEHLELLGVQTTSTMAQLAEAVAATLGGGSAGRAAGGAQGGASANRAGRAGAPSSGAGAVALPPRAFFLEDVKIDPAAPPPREALVDELRALRRECGEALLWEHELRSAAARAPLSEVSFIYRYILRDSCSQFDSLPLISLTPYE